MKAIRHISLLTLLLTLCFALAGQEPSNRQNDQDSAQRRLFPSQKDNRRNHGKQDMKAVIDSLNRVIEVLQNEISQRDSIENEMVELIEAEESELPEDSYTVEKTDSLLNMWYLQNQISRQEYELFDDLEDIGRFNSDSVRFTTNVPDSVLMERLKRMNSFSDRSND